MKPAFENPEIAASSMSYGSPPRERLGSPDRRLSPGYDGAQRVPLAIPAIVIFQIPGSAARGCSLAALSARNPCEVAKPGEHALLRAGDTAHAHKRLLGAQRL